MKTVKPLTEPGTAHPVAAWPQPPTADASPTHLSASALRVRLVQAANAILGEGPLWVAEEQALYWVDIARPAIYRHSPTLGQTGMWILPEKAGCIAVKGPGQLWVACRSGLHTLDTEHGQLLRVSAVEQPSDGHRFNDGAVDRSGRFWLGVMNEAQPGPHGRLCRYDGPDKLQTIEAGWHCPNGLDWSPDGRVFYATDSGLRTIWRYDYDPATGMASERQVFKRLEANQGVPDGLTVDSEGCVWAALWDGWCVERYDPQGQHMLTLPMPVQRPTSVTFGGDDLRTLFITSASVNVGPDGLRRGAQAGGLFAVDTPVSGLPAPVARLTADDASDASSVAP